MCDITDLRLCEIELERRAKILDEEIEKQENLRALFDNCPTMMGIIELVDQNIIVKLANPAAQEYHQMIYGRSIYENKFTEEEIEIWRSNYLKCSKLEKPIYFEMPDDSHGN